MAIIRFRVGYSRISGLAGLDSVMIKDGNSSVSCRIFTDFGSCGSGFGDDFSLTVFEFGASKLIEFGFSPVVNRLE